MATAAQPATAPETAHVVFTTHWDREWVQTFEQYRFRLVGLIDRLLDILEAEPALRFVFDGQSIVIEDYLEIRPEHGERLRALAQAGRIVFGPWYVLADQFLECEEATVRNLQIGAKLSRGFGGAMPHGYVPDSFGSIATLPAILNGFGITSCNFGRGPAHMIDGAKGLYRWRWKDGSEALACVRGYGNGMFVTRGNLGHDLDESLATPEQAIAAARKQIESESRAFPAGPLYFSAGCDHMEMRGGVTAILDALNAAGLGMRFVASDPASFMRDSARAAAAKGVAIEAIQGEMRGMPTWPMSLQGVLSTHREMKRLNRECELLLTRALEPLELVHGALRRDSHRHFVERAWKLVVQNHPHDSICACSRDEVIADILQRFNKVRELHAVMSERLLRELLPRRVDTVRDAAAAPAVAVLNATPRRGRSPFALRVRVPTTLDAERWSVVDESGQAIGIGRRVAKRGIDLETWYATNDDLVQLACKNPGPKRDPTQVYTLVDVEGVADFGDAAGFRLLRLAPPREEAAQVAANGESIANGCLELSRDAGGGLALKDLASGAQWTGLCWFEDCADRGDTYDFQPLAGDVPLSTRAVAPVSVTARVVDARTAELEVVSLLQIPERSGREGRSSTTIPHRIVAVYTIHAGVPRVEARLTFENRAVHHRLRVGFAFAKRPAVSSGGHFAAMDRAWTQAGERLPCRPMTDWLRVADERGGLAVLTKGLYELEARSLPGEGGEVLVTLLRAVDMIGPAAGCNYPVTHAQERGEHAVEFALAPASTDADAIHAAAAFAAPLLGEACLGTPDDATLARLPRQLLAVEPRDLAVTCLKRGVDGDGTIVRFFNPGGEKLRARVRLGLPWTTATAVDLAEQPTETAVTVADGEAALEVGPYAIVTLRFA
jgi:hypothetical protein